MLNEIRFGATEKTRTSTGYYPTATSTLRVYQFRHDRKPEADLSPFVGQLQALKDSLLPLPCK
jgi:hypothetical protein